MKNINAYSKEELYQIFLNRVDDLSRIRLESIDMTLSIYKMKFTNLGVVLTETNCYNKSIYFVKMFTVYLLQIWRKASRFIQFSFQLTRVNRGIVRRAKRNGRTPSYDWRAFFMQTVATRGKSCYNRIGFPSANLAAASAEGDNSCKAEIHPPPFLTPTRSANSACGCSATAPSSCWSSC